MIFGLRSFDEAKIIEMIGFFFWVEKRTVELLDFFPSIIEP